MSYLRPCAEKEECVMKWEEEVREEERDRKMGEGGCGGLLSLTFPYAE